ncbi:hypothetical protein GH714_015883 [Hevea brasiliensis]|uniref:Sm domain-containing protein n=1 Tax=Hevea brasiliensis TaxID=3981 RepID=A0A6A6N4E1_HEVBR|nr:hypothetical protein GH714_015883 [Hevea brasiliensis]
MIKKKGVQIKLLSVERKREKAKQTLEGGRRGQSRAHCTALLKRKVLRYSCEDVREERNGVGFGKICGQGCPSQAHGGRQVTGTLKGYDQLLNLVLDEAIEYLRDPDDPLKTTDQTRRLGLIVCRGTAVMLVSPTDGTDEIANPFLQPDGA